MIGKGKGLPVLSKTWTRRRGNIGKNMDKTRQDAGPAMRLLTHFGVAFDW